MPAPPPALEISGLRFAWPAGRRGAGFALAVGELAIARGERVFLHGPSGSGKSTLLALICGILAPQAGEIRLAGAPFSALSAARRDRMRAERLGIVFQMFNLLPYASVLDNVLLPLAFAPERARRVGPDRRAEARRLLAALGLPEAALAAASAARLSVGQQQRVAVARALIGGPEIVVADEPTSALDAGTRAAFMDLLFAQVAAAGATLLMVSHDAGLAARFDRSLALDRIARTEAAA
ncbi:ABC transporter ATP-binding protein [Paralimibaculum aggregatum]|uniref:ABC transporter ATP-binding protein n=1 Tax=Paralimibaculum aggregatum TaxID=3036245 RepID=A0ABQ6LKE9_9RHOB|nr:ATP-binding cassette domain-containing protein [Limibaculum sp. NKW23]GMG82147.1 ABC transporter ATP-binding protein [Limibaculum sp. NKW23]